MEWLHTLLNVKVFLQQMVDAYPTGVYGILFLILFAETGLVVVPFLPGDSLLFAVGALAGTGTLDIKLLYPLLLTAVFLGDNTNYWIGRYLGPKVFRWESSRFFNKAHLEKTHSFFEKYGTKTIIYARFVPFVRTFTPFVAGVGSMPYPRFLLFCVLGCLLWMTVCMLGGYYFGKMIPEKKFELVVIGIIFVSIIPAALEYLKHRHESK